MKSKHLVKVEKEIIQETEWRKTDISPRYYPCYNKTYPNRDGWKWKFAKLISENNENTSLEFSLLCMCNPLKGNWKSILMAKKEDECFAVARFEYHSSHPGIHIHSNCSDSSETGTRSLDFQDRIPKTTNFHRKKNAFNDNLFWEKTKEFFNIPLGKPTQQVLFEE